jgi:hypothetical protein
MKHRSTFWQGAWVAGIMALSIPPSVYGQAAGSDASERKGGTTAGCPSAGAGSSQPDLTESRTMPTDVSDLRGTTNAHRSTSPTARELGGTLGNSSATHNPTNSPKNFSSDTE